MLLKDKVAIVTGAAKGIGYATVKRFLEEGAIVVAIDNSNTFAKSISSLFYDESNLNRLFYMTVDVTNYEELSKTVDKTLQIRNRIDIVVNNAAVNIPGDVEELSLDNWNKSFDVNLTSQFLMAKIVSPIMKKQGFGSIINMASANAVVAEKRLVGYGATKGGIDSFTQFLAYDLAPYGVRANCIGPGLVNTGFNDDHHDLVDGGRAEVMKHIKDIHPTGREVFPEEVADTAVFLGSNMSKSIIGQLILVDGGMSIK